MLAMLFCVACSNEESSETEPVQENDNQQITEESKEEIVQEDTKDELKEKDIVIICYPDEMGEIFLTEEIEYNSVSEDIIWNLLKEKKVIEEGCSINSFEMNDSLIKLDVNESFGMQLRSSGTLGEEIMIHCVVNSFLESYECERILITENGEILQSGHVEYAKEFVKFE